MNTNLAGLISALGKGVQGYGIDQEKRTAGALRQHQQDEDDKRNRVMLALAGKSFDPSRGVVVDEGTATATPVAGLPPAVKTPHRTYDPMRGALVDEDAGTAAPVQGLPDRPAPEPSGDHFTFPTGTDPEGKPVVLRANTRTGAVDATDVGARPSATARPSDSQEKSFLFYNLMKNAEPGIQQAMASGNIRKAAITAYINSPDIAAAAIYSRMNDDEQALIRNFADFGAGVLRKESGAALNHEDLRSVWDRYGARWGEGDRMDDDKAKARASYMQSMELEAGPAIDFNASRARRNATPTGGGSPALPPLSDEDKAKARTDPGFAAWLKTKGYTL